MVNWENITTPSDMLQIANTNTSGYFWRIILYLITLVLMLAMINFGIEVSLLVSVMIGIILGIILLYMGLISAGALGFLVAIELFAVIYLLITSSKNQ